MQQPVKTATSVKSAQPYSMLHETDLLRFVLDIEDPRGFIVTGWDSEPMLPIIGSAGIVACPCLSKTGLASIDQVHVQVQVSCTSQSIMKPSAVRKLCYVISLFGATAHTRKEAAESLMS